MNPLQPFTSSEPDDDIIELMVDLHVGETEARFISGLISGSIVGDNITKTETGQVLPAGKTRTLDDWMQEKLGALPKS